LKSKPLGQFLQFGIKIGGDGFLRFDHKIGGDGFSQFDLKIGGSGFSIWASKPTAMIW
jgi:hypothetical protein